MLKPIVYYSMFMVAMLNPKEVVEKGSNNSENNDFNVKDRKKKKIEKNELGHQQNLKIRLIKCKESTLSNLENLEIDFHMT